MSDTQLLNVHFYDGKLNEVIEPFRSEIERVSTIDKNITLNDIWRKISKQPYPIMVNDLPPHIKQILKEIGVSAPLEPQPNSQNNLQQNNLSSQVESQVETQPKLEENNLSSQVESQPNLQQPNLSSQTEPQVESRANLQQNNLPPQTELQTESQVETQPNPRENVILNEHVIRGNRHVIPPHLLNRRLNNRTNNMMMRRPVNVRTTPAMICLNKIMNDYKQFGRTPQSGNYDPSNNLYADDILYLIYEIIVKNGDGWSLLENQLEEMTSGLCPQGRTTRLLQILISLQT